MGWDWWVKLRDVGCVKLGDVDSKFLKNTQEDGGVGFSKYDDFGWRMNPQDTIILVNFRYVWILRMMIFWKVGIDKISHEVFFGVGTHHSDDAQQRESFRFY